MSPFFADPQRITQLQKSARLWLGTPFMPNAAVRGAGVSCQKLVGSIYRELGAVPGDFQIPEGPMDWSHAQTKSLIAEFMATLPMFQIVARDEKILPGDMVGFKIGGCLHHCGLVVTGELIFIHCLRGQGTVMNNLRDAAFLKRIEKVWRPVQQ
jgi:cell wall-associated NlpC family hydrolase